MNESWIKMKMIMTYRKQRGRERQPYREIGSVLLFFLMHSSHSLLMMMFEMEHAFSIDSHSRSPEWLLRRSLRVNYFSSLLPHRRLRNVVCSRMWKDSRERKKKFIWKRQRKMEDEEKDQNWERKREKRAWRASFMVLFVHLPVIIAVILYLGERRH